MKKMYLLVVIVFTLAFTACSDDDNSSAVTTTQVAFVNQTINISQVETTVNVVFSTATTASGIVILNVEPTDVTYGTDFTTSPEVSESLLSLPFEQGVTSVSFTFNKLTEAIEGEEKNVKFTILSIEGITVDVPTNTNYTQLNFNEVAITNNIVSPNIGGNTFPNNVYIDLSSGQVVEVIRTSWELGFYSGSDFRVVMNPAINKFAIKQLTTTNIDEVQAEDTSVTTGDYDPAGAAYIDHPYGNLSGTAIAEVSATDEDNKVYLVNLGQTISSTPATGTSAALTGDSRGWKKIRILRSGNDYKIQFADIDATTHSEVTISKDSNYNFTFFDLVNGTIVSAEPQQDKWDLNLGTFMNYTQYNGQDISYFYSDFVTTNTLAGTRTYEVLTSDYSYDDFILTNVDTANLSTQVDQDRRVIGANWRGTYPSPAVKTDRFYVVQDIAGNIYKLKFTAMLNSSSERGNITFEYEKLN